MSTGGNQRDNVQGLLALSGVAGPILFAVVVTILGFVGTDYSQVEHLISQLGATGVQYAGVLNINFILTGLLLVAFAVGLYRSVGNGRAGMTGSGLVVLAGIGVIGSGVFPEDLYLAVEEATFSEFMHDFFGVVASLAAVIATVIFSRILPRDDVWRRYRPYSLITGVVAFGLLVLASLADPEKEAISALQPWAGLLQRSFLAVCMLWIAVMGLRLFRLAGQPSR